jgi:hypothetical protein
MACQRCMDSGLVCERHPFMPGEGPYSCGCGAPSAPCPACNSQKIDGIRIGRANFGKFTFGNTGWVST